MSKYNREKYGTENKFVVEYFKEKGTYLVATELDDINVVMELFSTFFDAYCYLKRIIRSYHCSAYIIEVSAKIMYKFQIQTVEIDGSSIVEMKGDEISEFGVNGDIPYLSNFTKVINSY